MNSTRKAATAALASVALMAAAGACGSDDTSTGGDRDDVAVIEVHLTDEGCDPHDLTATAGPTTFEVTNDESAVVTEFEVLDGDSIKGEVENIAVGFNRSFTMTLEPGEYTTRCNLGSDEYGTLTVEAASSASTATPEEDALATAAVDTYLQYVQQEADLLVDAVGPFVAAVKAGDVDQAKALFAPAREHYETIEPIAESFGDLDPRIDARDGDVPAEEWGGFHRIEQALWEENDASAMGPVADALLTDVQELQSKIPTITLEPAQIANGAVELLNEVASSKITGEEDRYSHTDLYDFDANLVGSNTAFDAVRPLLAAADEDAANTIDERFGAVADALAAHQTDDGGYVLYTELTADQTRELTTLVDALAEPLSQVAATIV